MLRGDTIRLQPWFITRRVSGLYIVPAPIGVLLRSQRGLTTAAATTAAKSLQSCPTLCDPIDSSPPGSSVPGILQARTLEWVAISSSKAWKWKVKVKSLSRVWLFSDPKGCSPPGFSLHGIFQASVLEWGAIAFFSDWLHRGLLHSFWQWEILVWNLVFISPGGLFRLKYAISMATRHMVQSSLKMQASV